MYKVILSVAIILITLTAFAQEFSFKPPTTTTRPATTSNGSNTIPTRGGAMSPDSFKKSVSSTTQNRSNTVNHLAGQKLKNNPEYSMPVSKTQKSANQTTGDIEQPTTAKQPVTKPTPQEQPPAQQYTPPQDTYTGFGQTPSGGSSPSKTNNNQNSSGGFGNIYQ